MKRIISLVLCLILLVSLTTIAVSAKDKFIVTLHWLTADEQEMLIEAHVDYGEEYYPLPPRTLKLDDDRVFGGWYYSTEYDLRYEKGAVYRSFDLYARYVDEDDIVVFFWFLDPEDIAPAGSAKYVKGDTAASPPDPEDPDMEFMGWYTDPEFTSYYDFSEPLEENTAIYARFADPEDIVYLGYYWFPDDEFCTGSGMYVKGDIPEYAGTPQPEGYEFLGWYTDGTFTEEYDFTEPIYENTDIYARLVPEEDIIYLGYYWFPDDEISTGSGMYAKGDIPEYAGDPHPEGYEFLGWYTDGTFSEEFDFSEPIYEDTNIYARFVPKEDVVHLNYYLGSSPNDLYTTQNYAKGDIPAEPYEPDPDYDEDKFFYGWYADKALTTPFDFSQPINKDKNAYAKFVGIKDTYTVRIYFLADNDTLLAGYDIAKGRPYHRPGDRGMEGYTFVGWFTDLALTIPADYVSPCYEDVNLYPKFVKAEDNHTDLRRVLIPAGTTYDGVREHLECAVCGKWFTCNTPTPEEIHDHEEYVIDATGPYVCGDTDGDGDTTILDATFIQRRLAELANDGTYCRGAADADGDGENTIIDATWIQRKLADFEGYDRIGTIITPEN